MNNKRLAQSTYASWLITASVVPIIALALSFMTVIASVQAESVTAEFSQIGQKQTMPNGCVGSWSVVTSPSPGGGDHTLYAVDAIASNDIWAVGSYSLQFNSPRQTLIEHWDGANWSEVTSPSIGSEQNVLHGVSAASPSDVWAVGFYRTSGIDYQLILRWDGNDWNQITMAGGNGVLRAVTAVSASDVWAVGAWSGVPLIVHWNGSAWSSISTPDPATYDTLYGVHASGPDDVWAIGSSFDEVQDTHSTLAMHWNGASWSVVPTPNTSAAHNYLYGVAALAPNDAWAVGSGEGGVGSEPLAMHWNGLTWSLAAISEAVGGGLNDVAALSSDDVWAVGFAYPTIGVTQTRTYHWDGSQWNIVPSPSIGQGYDNLLGVAPVSSVDVWAVGVYDNPSNSHIYTLVEHYTNSCPTPTNTPVMPSPTRTNTSTRTPTLTPIPTQTPGGPTATPKPTETPMPTATPCMLAFTDVPSNHTFYSFIRCLACRGILSGYADGTFRPGNEITRSQIAKMVSNAAGINDGPGPQIFEDVDPTNTFFTWINRLANRGFMGGYPCGGEGEPCSPNNWPYFRPFANATRGQLAKIVSNAAGVGGSPAGQFYADVLEDHPFYVWIMRLTQLGVMSGYPCGGDGEPCDDQNRPYFRPYNNVTRGQASKIVANTFFPNCETPVRP